MHWNFHGCSELSDFLFVKESVSVCGLHVDDCKNSWCNSLYQVVDQSLNNYCSPSILWAVWSYQSDNWAEAMWRAASSMGDHSYHLHHPWPHHNINWYFQIIISFSTCNSSGVLNIDYEHDTIFFILVCYNKDFLYLRFYQSETDEIKFQMSIIYRSEW